jgi:hypothetical protein
MGCALVGDGTLYVGYVLPSVDFIPSIPRYYYYLMTLVIDAFTTFDDEELIFFRFFRLSSCCSLSIFRRRINNDKTRELDVRLIRTSTPTSGEAAGCIEGVHMRLP